jgi:hypothetical protein
MPSESVDLRKEVRDVFSNPDNRQLGDEYAKEIRENWREVNSSRGRSSILLLASIFAFELLARASISKASIVGLEIKDLTFPRLALPVISAYLFYDIVNLWTRHMNLREVHLGVVNTLHPDLYKKP